MATVWLSPRCLWISSTWSCRAGHCIGEQAMIDGTVLDALNVFVVVFAIVMLMLWNRV